MGANGPVAQAPVFAVDGSNVVTMPPAVPSRSGRHRSAPSTVTPSAYFFVMSTAPAACIVVSAALAVRYTSATCPESTSTRRSSSGLPTSAPSPWIFTDSGAPSSFGGDSAPG
ncbi:MAG: hypothetical protein IT374_08435 [Polyangiaceae bacterium]|nr:hypothetical protein [Polyangiaceae bacterium]